MARTPYISLDSDTRRSSSKTFLTLFILLITFVLAVFVFKQKELYDVEDGNEEPYASPVPDDSESKASPIFEAFFNCVQPKLVPLLGNYDEFWVSFVKLTKECDDLEEYKAIDLRKAQNQDEIKYIAYPKKEENLTMVTFGIGHDVSAEKKLKEMYSNISFYGADPSTYMNKDLYEKELGGKYFEYAISGQSGRLNSRVFGKGGYREEVTKGIGADDFFADKVQKSKIDFLWIDVEGHEYPILDQLHHKGALDKKGVKICQMNVEMHKDTFKESLGEKKKFHDFVWNVLEDKRFIMLKPVFVIYKEKRFIRTFIVNVSDKECTELFLS